MGPLPDSQNPFKAHKSPTCYTIRRLRIEDEAQVRAVWMWSGLIADDLWGRVSARDKDYQRRGKQVLGLVVEAFDGTVPHDVRDVLRSSLILAIQYCRETAL